MSNTKGGKRAFSLVEMMVAVAIVVVLMAVLGLAVGPAAKKSGMKATLTARLRQTAGAINLYMTDWDGFPPLTLQVLVKDHTLDRETVRSPLAGFDFHYTRAFVTTHRDGTAGIVDGFVESRDSIVKAFDWHDFDCGPHDERCTVKIYRIDGRNYVHKIPTIPPGQVVHVLGARLDGSVGWFPMDEEWEKPFLRVPLPGPK